jgi:outer membrane protein assembly factor BamB
MFVCVELKTGDVRWKARGYGSGQVLLLAKQGLLVILTEKGELALVEAKPGAHRELSKLQVLEGKTWNHPVIAQGKIFVRNGDEIACLELPKAVSGSAKD